MFRNNIIIKGQKWPNVGQNAPKMAPLTPKNPIFCGGVEVLLTHAKNPITLLYGLNLRCFIPISPYTLENLDRVGYETVAPPLKNGQILILKADLGSLRPRLLI